MAGYAAKFLQGVVIPLRAAPLLFKKKVLPYAACPFILSALVLSFGAIALGSVIDTSIALALPNWPNWITSILSWFITVIISIWISFCLIGLANIIACPFNSLLSSKVLQILSDPDLSQTNRISLVSEIIDSLGAFKSEIKKIIHYLKYALIILLCSFLPVINMFSPVLWILFGAWMLTIEYLDYPFENDGTVFPQSLEAIAGQKSRCLGFGLSLTLIALTPILNWFTIAIGVTSATVLYHEEFNAKKKQ